MVLSWRRDSVLCSGCIRTKRFLGWNVARTPDRARSNSRADLFSAEKNSSGRMGCLDAISAFASSSKTRLSDREFQSWCRSIGSVDECAGGVLHDVFSSAVFWLFCFRFRARIFVLLVREIFRLTGGGRLGPAANRSAQSSLGDLWCGLGSIFELRSVVVLVANHAAGNDGELVRLSWLRHQFF